MSGFVPALMQIVQPEPDPKAPKETPEQKKRRQLGGRPYCNSVGGIPKQNFWKGRDA